MIMVDDGKEGRVEGREEKREGGMKLGRSIRFNGAKEGRKGNKSNRNSPNSVKLRYYVNTLETAYCLP